MTQTNIISIIQTIISALGFIFVILELNEMKKQRDQSRKETRINHSIELAKDFQQLISDEIFFIIEPISSDKKYSEIISKIDDRDLRCFDKNEFNRLCNKYADLKSIENYFYDDFFNCDNLNSIAQVFLHSKNISNDDYNEIMFCCVSKWSITEEETKILSNKDIELDRKKEIITKNMTIHYRRDMLERLYRSKVTDMLNKLEYLTIPLNTDLADEDIVYQSLHQLFLKTVKFLYPVICSANKNENANKYYSHVIERYVKWSDRYAKELEKEINSSQKTTKLTSKF